MLLDSFNCNHVYYFIVFCVTPHMLLSNKSLLFLLSCVEYLSKPFRLLESFLEQLGSASAKSCTFSLFMCKSKFLSVDTNQIKSVYPIKVSSRRKLNVHKTFRRRPGRLLNVLYIFSLRPVSMGT